MKKSIGIMFFIILFVVFQIGLTTSCSENLPVKAGSTDTLPPTGETGAELQTEVTEKEESQVFKPVEISFESNEETIVDETNEYNSISLIMVGDILLHTQVNDSGKMEDGTYNYEYLFKYVKNDINAADIAIVNQEVILGGTELGLSGYPRFNGAYEVGDALVKAGFDVVLHATNHTLDKGKQGVANCMTFWEEKHPDIGVLGINKSQKEKDEKIYVIERKGIKIAILNYTSHTNGITPPTDMPYIVNYMNMNKMAKDVERAKKLADFIVVCPHWGDEYKHLPSQDQKNIAQFLTNLGVDLIIGAHPHVIQPVLWLENNQGKKTLVYYSLGNFVNSTSGTGYDVSDRMVGAMANVTISKDESGDVYISDYKAEPMVTHKEIDSKLITTYKFSDYSEDLAVVNAVVNQDANFSFFYCKQIWNQTMALFMQ